MSIGYDNVYYVTTQLNYTRYAFIRKYDLKCLKSQFEGCNLDKYKICFKFKLLL